MKGWFDLNNKILVADDEKEIRDLLEIYLLNEGYKVVKAKDGQEALDIIENEDVDLLVLDIMMPKVNGIEVCKKVRQNKNMPILMLSAKSEDMDKIQGLMTGADDYMTKPFGILELQARVLSLLRRHVTSDVIKTKHLVVDKQTRMIKMDGKKLELTNKEYQLLVYLMDNKHRVVEREELLNEIWGYDFIGESRALDVHIRALRSKLNDDGHKYIKTIRSVGYRFYEEGDDSE